MTSILDWGLVLKRDPGAAPGSLKPNDYELVPETGEMRPLARPLKGIDYEVLKSGVIRIARCRDDPTCGICSEKPAPSYLRLLEEEMTLPEEKYLRKEKEQEERFAILARQLKKHEFSLAVVLHGKDLAGKSGAARRILDACESDPKLIRWIPIDKPHEDELRHGYLWRFFQEDRMPRSGQVRIFDRSWYERVLAEPIKGLIDRGTTLRSYPQLRTFDWLLRQQRVIVVKIFMDISYDEQEKRLAQRKEEKSWKVSPDDDEAHKRWNEFCALENMMLHFTGTPYASWHIVAANCKRYSRVTVLRTINDVMASVFPEAG